MISSIANVILDLSDFFSQKVLILTFVISFVYIATLYFELKESSLRQSYRSLKKHIKMK